MRRAGGGAQLRATGHILRQVHHDHSRIEVAKVILIGPAKGGAAQREDAEDDGQNDGRPYAPGPARAAACHHRRKQGRVDRALPTGQGTAFRFGEHEQKRENGERKQPPGAQQGDIAERDHRRDRRAATMPAAASMKNAAG